jgi:carbamate kinase
MSTPVEVDRVVTVLGGNALVKAGQPLTMAGQFRFAAEALSYIRPLLAPSSQLLITHGNGPQVGHILTRVEEALGKVYAIPLEVCVAESEGELGYVLAQTLHNLLDAMNTPRPIANLLTQVVVDADDPAFGQPSKPIGPFYTHAQADELRHKRFRVVEDSGRGYRRVVPSPRPKEIVETSVIEQLLSAGVIVIAAGGGGVPVVRENGYLRGVEAVVDKDLASALLGKTLGARLMVILTGVPCAYCCFGTARQQPIGRIDAHKARQLVLEGHFAPGSMLPKMQAAIEFATQPGAKAIICDPPSLTAALVGKAGTIVESQSREPYESQHD